MLLLLLLLSREALGMSYMQTRTQWQFTLFGERRLDSTFDHVEHEKCAIKVAIIIKIEARLHSIQTGFSLKYYNSGWILASVVCVLLYL